MFEVYSRDFTINCLHKRLLASTLIDLTGKSLSDIENKIILRLLIKLSLEAEVPINVFSSLNFINLFIEDFCELIDAHDIYIDWKEGSNFCIPIDNAPKVGIIVSEFGKIFALKRLLKYFNYD